MGVDRSKRVHVSLDDAVYKDLEDWAEQQGRPTANLAAFLVERSIAQAKETGEFVPSTDRPPEETTNDRAKAFIRDLALGRVQNVLDVQRLADELGVPSKRLAEIIKQNGGTKKDVGNRN